MKRPVSSFFDERLTDAPFEALAARLREPSSFKQLAFAAPFVKVEEGLEEVRLLWTRRRYGAEEQGWLLARPHAKGAHLSIEVRMKGWGGFLGFGLLRWRADGLLDRLVEEL